MSASIISATVHGRGTDFFWGGQFRLGAAGTTPSIPATSQYCGQHVQEDLWQSQPQARRLEGCTQPGDRPSRVQQSSRSGSRVDIEAKLPLPNDQTLLKVPHTPTSYHLCNRCSHHAMVCNGETQCKWPPSSRSRSYSCLTGGKDVFEGTYATCHSGRNKVLIAWGRPLLRHTLSSVKLESTSPAFC